MIKKKLLTDKSGTLHEEYLNAASKQLADDIDFEIIMGLLTETGWTKVVLQPMTWEQGDAIDLWVMKNTRGKHHTRGLVWLFEDQKDANWFKVRWL